jgi:hypothetical protein
MTPRRRRRGHALIGTMTFLVLVMFLWLAAFGQLSSCARAEKVCLLRHDRAIGPTRALAYGLALLETGVPEPNPYACRYTPDAVSGRQFVITFQESAIGVYHVAVAPAGPEDDSLPLAPKQFTSTEFPPPKPL